MPALGHIFQVEFVLFIALGCKMKLQRENDWYQLNMEMSKIINMLKNQRLPTS